MLPDRVSNPGPLTYESGALPIALRGPAFTMELWFHVYIAKMFLFFFHVIEVIFFIGFL